MLVADSDQRLAEVAQRWSVIIPVLNDAQALRGLLAQLNPYPLEIVVCDGGSADASVAVAREFGVQVCCATGGRGAQLNAGVQRASRAWLWFLHADSSLNVAPLLRQLGSIEAGAWGHFRVAIRPANAALQMIAWFMQQRTQLTRICTGDQGIFCSADLLNRIGGMPVQPLMEDIELSRRLKQVSAQFVSLPGPLVTSSRRWQRRGILRTVLSMWWYRVQYFCGVSANALYRRYYGP